MQQYLSDFVHEVAKTHAEKFLQGHVVPELEQIRESAKCIAYMDVVEIELEQIFDFYKEEDDAKETAGQPAPPI